MFQSKLLVSAFYATLHAFSGDFSSNSLENIDFYRFSFQFSLVSATKRSDKYLEEEMMKKTSKKKTTKKSKKGKKSKHKDSSSESEEGKPLFGPTHPAS